MDKNMKFLVGLLAVLVIGVFVYAVTITTEDGITTPNVTNTDTATLNNPTITGVTTSAGISDSVGFNTTGDLRVSGEVKTDLAFDGNAITNVTTIRDVSSEGLLLAISFNNDSLFVNSSHNITLDSSTSMNHGLTDNVTFLRTGGLNGGGAIRLNAGNNRVNLGTASIVKPTQNITWSTWIKRLGDSCTNAYIIRSGATGEPMFIESGTTGRLQARIKTSDDNEVTLIDNVVISSTDYNHFVMTYNSSNFILYKDGVSINSTAATGTLVYDNSELFIGRETTECSFNGTIDDFRIYNRALSASDVEQMYERRLEIKPVGYKTRNCYWGGNATCDMKYCPLSTTAFC